MEHHYLRPLFDPAVIHVYAAAAGAGYSAALNSALAEGVFSGTIAHWLQSDDGGFRASPEIVADIATIATPTVPDLSALARQ